MSAIVALIRNNRLRELRERLLTLTEAQRGEIGRDLPGVVKDLRAEQIEELNRRDFYDDWERDWERSRAVDEMLDSRATALLLAGLGTITGPAAAVSWITSRDVNRRQARDVNVADAVKIAASRPIEWQQDVAVRLARRIRRPDDRIAPLAIALLRASGAEPPDHDPLVAAWLRAITHPGDPLTPKLLPRIFDAEGAGRELRDEYLTPAPTRWLARARKDLPRDQAIDGCVSRFLRGGDAQDLRFFVRLHDLLAPTFDETAERLRDYLRLLPAAPGTVADLAAKQVKRLFPIDRADLVEAVESLTFRPEAKLATVGLRWLDAELKRNPSAVAEFTPALLTAYGHTSFDVQSRAVDLTVKHVTDASLIADAIESLPAGLGARLSAHFSGEAAPEETRPAVTFPPLPEVAAPQPFPEPTVSTTIEAAAHWVTAERWLAAFVTRATADREALRAELHRHQNRGRWQPRWDVWVDPRDWIKALYTELITPGATPDEPQHIPWRPEDHLVATKRTLDPRRWTFTGNVVAFSAEPYEYFPGPDPSAHGHRPAESGVERPGLVYEAPEPAVAEHVASLVDVELVESVDEPDGPAVFHGHHFVEVSPPAGPWVEPGQMGRNGERLPAAEHVPPLHLFLLHRFDELLDALRADALPPVLLATPTLGNGHLDPEVLADRLETCAEAGVEPLPADLAQALMRLPRGAHPAAAERAAKVGSSAGHAAAEWLAGDGMPDPVTGFDYARPSYAGDGMPDPVTGFGWARPSHAGDRRMVPVLRVAAPTGHRLIDEVLLATPTARAYGGYPDALKWFPSIVPSHREVASVNYLLHAVTSWEHPTMSIKTFQPIATTDGPTGDATAVILGQFLSSQPTGKVGELMLSLAARDSLPATALGRQLGVLLYWQSLEVGPLFEVLADLAHKGAPHQVWDILRPLLPSLIPGEGRRVTAPLSEAIVFAADVASWVGARGEIPEITAYAAGRSRSRFARECRRLRDQLNPARV
ncbi:hypothetical protein [Herbidospora mongoliensis]|uniref:hypothetical protein n=1 Tax=Herbidospora mongoliensis TaxID=688067 RepID=UPI0008320F95|nr:hypothetical protein [Herbidospora mongoliensis]